MTVLETFLSRITDAYDKSPDSNIHKLLEIASQGRQEFEDNLARMEQWNDVDKAEGAALDLLGATVRQQRGQAPDSIYRVLIKSKVKRALSNGSVDTLIDFLSFILNCKKSEIVIRPLWDVGKPAELQVDVPSSNIVRTGLSRNQFGTLVNLIVAAGIQANVLFAGTFGFSDIYTESQEGSEFGFADDEGTTGGELGDTFDPVDDYELPF